MVKTTRQNHQNDTSYGVKRAVVFHQTEKFATVINDLLAFFKPLDEGDGGIV